jgi:hypothetical protein
MTKNTFSQNLVYRTSVVAFSCIAILTSAASCSLLPQIGNSKNSKSYGLLKKDPSVKDIFGRINNIRYSDGKTNPEGLQSANIVEIEQLSSNNLFVLTENKGIFETNDGGRNWDRSYIFPIISNAKDQKTKDTEITSIIQKNDAIIGTDFEISSRNPNLVLVTGSINGISKIWRSEDGGKSYKEVYSEIDKGNNLVGVEIDSKNDNIVLGLLEGGVVIRSLDAGKTWSKIKDFSSNAVQIGVVPEFDNLLFVLFTGKPMQYSSDSGVTWQESVFSHEQSNIGESQAKDFTIRSDIFKKESFGQFEELIPVKKQKNSWILLADNQVWYTDRLDQPFIKMVLPLTDEKYKIAAVGIDPDKGVDRLLVSIEDNLFETTNRGQSWTTSDLVGLSTPSGDINNILIDKYNTNIIYMGLTGKTK